MVIISKVLLRMLLDISSVQSSSQHLRGTLTAALERHLAIEDFTAIDQHTC